MAHPDNQCDCCGNEKAEADADRADALRDDLRSNPSFIGEAIGNGDLSNLVEAFNTVDPQRCWDAVHDLVNDYLKAEESSAGKAVRIKTGAWQSDLAAVEYLAGLHGVSP